MADVAREKVQRELLPAVSSALASAVAVLEVAKDQRVREALSQVRRAGNTIGKRVGIAPAKPPVSAGRYVLVALAAVAAAGVAYAAWQTLRPDEDLWVADDENDGPVTVSGARV